MAEATYYNGLTGETIYREETATEIAERENLQKVWADKDKADADAQTERVIALKVVLDRLGITADEAALLFN